MDDFKKAYVYDGEEKSVSGLLLVYFFLLLAEESFFGIMSLFYGYDKMFVNRPLGIGIMISAVLFALFAVFSAIVLKLRARFALKVSKAFLIVRLFYLIPYLIMTMLSQIEKIPYVKGNDKYWVEYNSIVNSFIISTVFVVIFSAGWFIYILKSNKVRELFPAKQKSSGAADLSSAK